MAAGNTRAAMDVQSLSGARETGAPSPGQNVDDGKGLAQVAENDENENDNDVCALFATAMPRDVWANPSLAALAALIDEDQEAKQEASEDDRGAGMDDDEEHSGSHQPTPRPGIPIATPTDEGALAKPPGARPFQDAPSVPSTSGGSSSGSAASGARCQRREDTRRKRNDRRASPYATPAGRRGRGAGRPSGRDGGAGGATRDRRQGPTPGETQVLMSLWGL
ncbi:unnamed protein product [Scytosiphon promiscuus]